MKILYFYISSYSFGNGHYVRAQSYKEKFIKKNCFFKIKNLVNEQDNMIYDLSELNDQINKSDYSFFDISNKLFFNKKKNLKYLKIIFNLYAHKIIIIDGLNKEIISNKLRYNFKTVIIPYIFNKKSLNIIKGVKYFKGIKYFINKDVKIYNYKKKSKEKNILFTSGGSDTENSTLKFLNLFKSLNLKLVKLFILLGPNFKKINIQKIKNFCKKKNFSIKLLKFKKDIHSNIFDKDLVITSSGLTKYDLLFLKKPFLVFLENKYQRLINKEFKKKFDNFYLEDLSYCKKNLIIVKNAICDQKYMNNYYKKVNNIKMNDFETIYNFIKK